MRRTLITAAAVLTLAAGALTGLGVQHAAAATTTCTSVYGTFTVQTFLYPSVQAAASGFGVSCVTTP